MFQNARTYLSEILKKPQAAENPFRYRDLLFFIRFVRPVWKLGAVTLMLTLITSGLGSLLPLSSKIFIDFVIMKKGFEKIEAALTSVGLPFLIQPIQNILSSLNLVILLILVIGTLIGTIRLIQNFLTLRFQQEITFNVQTALFDHILRFPLSLLKEKQVGYLMSRVSNDVGALQFFFSGAVPQLLTNSFYILFSFGIIFTLNSKLSLILASIIPLWALVNYFLSSRVRAVSRKEMEKQADISKDMQEVLSGAEVIKANVSEDRELAKISGKIRNLFRTRIKTSLLTSASGHFIKASKFLMVLFIIWLSVREIQNGQMTIGDMTAMISYVVYLSGMANNFSSMFLNLQTILASMERLTEMFHVVPEFGDDERFKHMLIPKKIKGQIRFADVSFFYESGKPVLTDISFTVRPGDVAALTGASGAGKTTLINLLLKFHMPRSGIIYLDEYDLKRVDTRWLRKQIGFVSQDIFLFNDTLENNIKYGKPSAAREEVIRAAKNANIHNEIEGFQDGYKTVAGERGVKLSVGQRQRISIARAFLKNPPILIFDEPTSALDAKTEMALRASLKKLSPGRIIFMITHRMAITGAANRIFILEDGKIRESSQTNNRKSCT
jgi:subfamily B ATP-binding cassette protein MsbA